MSTKAAAWVFIGCLVMTFSGLVALRAQPTRTVIIAWDAYDPVNDGAWTQVRVYELSGGVYTLRGSVNCTVGSPTTCPTSISLTTDKQAHTYVARSFDGSIESDDSNTVTLPKGPQAPKNMRRM